MSSAIAAGRPAPGKPYTSPYLIYFLYYLPHFPAALLASITGRVVPRRKGNPPSRPSLNLVRASVFFAAVLASRRAEPVALTAPPRFEAPD